MTGTMKIAVIAPETLPIPPERGGAVQTVIHHQSIRLKGHQVTVYCPRGPCQLREETVGHIRYVRIDVPHGEKKEMRDEYVKMVAEKLAKREADWIHIHNRPEFVLPLAEKRKKANILLHLHNAHLLKFSRQEMEKIAGYCTKIAFVSKYLKVRTIRRFPRLKPKSVIVYNGVDPEQFPPPWEQKETRIRMRNLFGYDKKDMVLLYVGRIIPQKGLLEVIQAIQMLKPTFRQIKLLVVGASQFGSAQMSRYEEQVRQAAMRLGNTVCFVGYIDQIHLTNYYQMADAFVAPVRWGEPFGLVFCEAASSGLPILATQLGAIPELIQDKREGLLLPARFRRRQLALLMKKLILNKSLRRQYSIKARNKIKQKFTWEHSCGQLEKVLGEEMGAARKA